MIPALVLAATVVTASEAWECEGPEVFDATQSTCVQPETLEIRAAFEEMLRETQSLAGDAEAHWGDDTVPFVEAWPGVVIWYDDVACFAEYAACAAGEFEDDPATPYVLIEPGFAVWYDEKATSACYSEDVGCFWYAN